MGMMSNYDPFLTEDLETVSKESLPYKELDNKTILITGATGLIGLSLVRTLCYIREKNNYNIQILALVRNKEKAETIYRPLLNTGFIRLIVSDITVPFSINENIDYLFHCASVTDSRIMITKPVEVIETSVIGTSNILRLAVKHNITAAVYLSSMEMYGTFKNRTEPVKENETGYIDPLAVRSNYPESKRICENMCIAYYSEYDVPIRIARLAQTFGAGILPGENRVFAQFARCVIDHEDIVLHTKGLSEGNYCYLSDAISGLLTIALCGKNGEAYNVCNEQTHTTIGKMAAMVVERFGEGKSKVVFDIPETNSFGYAPDIQLKLDSSKLKQLGWVPRKDLYEAYRRLIGSMRYNSNSIGKG